MIASSPARETQSPSTQIYNASFWLAYLANVLVVTAHSLTFRFADYVKHLGGNEALSGRIMSVAICAAVIFRFYIGQKIDQQGTRRIWLASSLVFIVSCLAFLSLNSVGWPMYVARILFNGSLAGMLSCSIVSIQNLAPADRRTEIIGSLGSSGFIAMILGPWLGDLIFSTTRGNSNQMLPYSFMWGTACAMGVVYLWIVNYLTRNDAKKKPQATPPGYTLLWRYWPGPILGGAIVVGVNFTVISVFLIRFAREIGIDKLGVFFTAYAVTAFLFRVGASGIAARCGRHRVVLIGLLGMAVGQFLFLTVRNEWMLILPATCAGFGHALLFPVVVSLGSGAFPLKYRGSGTTLILGFTELGTIISAPILGTAIVNLDPYGYAAMFVGTGLFTLAVMVYYALTAARLPDVDRYPQDLRQLAREERTKVTSEPAPVAGSSEPQELPVRPLLETRTPAVAAEPVVCRSPEP